MSASNSLYRKYRSQTFDELVGQEPVVRTLNNAIASGRISHAYLFTGPRGVGKTSAARLLARAANCLSDSPNKPCNECANCTIGIRDAATDLIEIDAASNTGVDNIREVIEKANFAPSIWSTKFYIIDEVHMLSMSAFNALLKTLEEPPPQTAFILATTEVHKVPATVASRCQRFDFRRVPLDAMVARLEHICKAEEIVAEREALELVARHATGSLRDALSLLDQLRVYSEGGITLESVQSLLGASGTREVAEFVDRLIEGDLAAGLRHVNRVLDDGLDLRQFNRQIVEYLRDLMLVKTGAASGDSSMLDATEEMKKQMQAQAERVTLADLLGWVEAFAEVDVALRSAAYRQLPLEVALVKAITRTEERGLRTEQGIPLSPQSSVLGTGRDRGAELSAGLGQVAVPPASLPVVPSNEPPHQRDRSQKTGEDATGKAAKPARITEPEGAPPPIHMEMQLPDARGKEEGRRQKDEPKEEGRRQKDEGDVVIHPSAFIPPPSNELERLKGLWGQVVDQINARSKNVASVFRDANLVRPYRVLGNVVTLSFRYPIQADRCRKEPWREVIEQSISRVLGYPCRVESILFNQEGDDEPNDEGGSGARKKQGPGNGPGQGAGSGSGPGATRETQSPYETTRGRAAMNIFGIEKFEEPQ